MAVRFAARHEMDVPLGSLAACGAVVLHDQRIPGSTATADHVAVAPSGVWVVHTKPFSGQVQKRDVGTLYSVDWRLYVGRRDCTRLLRSVTRGARALRAALDEEAWSIPVLPVLCFPEAEWSWFAKPFQMSGTVVASAKATSKLVGQPGPWTSEDVHRIAHALAA